MKTKQHMHCNLKIDTLDAFTGDTIQLESNSRYTLIIDYPLKNMHAVIIKTGKNGMGQAALLKRIGREYKYVYNYGEQFGTWGHYLGDLYLEQLHVDHESKKITLAVGS